jgi:hypothetical protein
MQETQFAWDSVMIHHDPGWAVRLYIYFLLYVFFYVSVRTVFLSRDVWFGLRRSSGLNEVDRNAYAALSGKVPSLDLSILPAVADRFDSLVAMSSIPLQSIRRLSKATILAAVIILAVGIINMLQVFSASKVLPHSVLCGDIAEALSYVIPGLVLAFTCYLISAIFEAMLARRTATWALFLAGKDRDATRKP